MAKEYVAGISVNSSVAQTLILETDDQKLEVVAIDEKSKEGTDEFWFLESLLKLEKRILSKIEDVAVGVDASAVYIHEFPIDSTLSQVDQNEHVNWELAQYISGYQKDQYINDVRILRTNAREQVLDVLVVSLKRTFLYSLHSQLSNAGLNFRAVDVNQFAAQHALLYNYPEVKLKVTALIGSWHDHVEISILRNGKLYRYEAIKSTTADNIVAKVNSMTQDIGLALIFLHGTGDTLEWTRGISNACTQNVTTLNPFRKVQDRASQKKLSRFVGSEHRFAAVVGSAMRYQ